MDVLTAMCAGALIASGLGAAFAREPAGLRRTYLTSFVVVLILAVYLAGLAEAKKSRSLGWSEGYNAGMQASYGRVASINDMVKEKAFQSLVDAMIPAGDYFVVAVRAENRTIEGLKNGSITFGLKKWDRLDFEIVDALDIVKQIKRGEKL
ncbi:MAG: hypothetical protein PHP03_00975 [Candidatus Pacebacteria bacterium]|nr:hypothetical protein [Candidatus Paceibacterota bacterium]